MKIFHGPIEIAGQIGTLCSGLVQLGHQANGYNFFQTYLDYHEHLMNTDVFEMGHLFEEAVRYYDLFHYHYGLTVFPKFKDLELLQKKRKPIVMHHWGNDVRTHSIASLNNPYVYTGDSPPEGNIHRSLAALSKYVQDAIVQDHEVFPYVSSYYKRVHVVPLALNLSRFSCSYPSLSEKEPLVVHAPTNKAFKGTEFVEKAINTLRQELPFRYVRVEKMAHHDAVRLYQQADIIIDQILCGSYGLLSVEGMAYGKPVISYVRDDLINGHGSRTPICSANPDTIYDVLKRLLLSPELRVQAGQEGRRYVEAIHDSGKVTRKVVEIYRAAEQAAKE